MDEKSLEKSREKRTLFSGNYERLLDDKFRVAIPARLRTQLETEQSRDEVIYVFYHVVFKRIMIYTVDGWYNFAQPLLDEIEDLDKKAKMREFIYKHLYEQRLDVQGRIKLEQKYFELMGIEKSVEILGSGWSITMKAPEKTKAITIDEEEAQFMKRINF